MNKRLIFLLFALGGVAALVYEVIWMRSFRAVFGSSAQSAAAVLAAYFGGMAVGNLLGAQWARRGRALWHYGAAELCVALAALLVAPWLSLFRSFYPTLYPWAAHQPALWTALKLLLALVALGPPTIAMGATLPLAIQALWPESGRLARATSLLYAVNVLGATLGAALAGFVLPMSVGVDGAIYLAAILNAVVGLSAIGLSLMEHRASATVRPAPATDPPVPLAAPARQSAWAISLAAMISGFGTLALEVLYVRILSFRSEGSVYSFSLMLVIFLLCLAAGSALIARLGDRVNLWRLLAVTQCTAMVGMLLCPFLFDLAGSVTSLAASDSLALEIARLGLVATVAMAPSVLLAGVTLPAIWKLASGDAQAMAHHVGRLTAVNTLAAVAGSLAMGFVLLPWLGLGGSLLLVAALYGALALVAFWIGYQGIGRWVGITASLGIPLAWFALGAWRLESAPLAKGETLVRHHDGAAATVSVIEQPGGHRTLRMNSNYTLGSSLSAARELSQGRLPLVLHPRPRRAAFIGVATGMTVSAALDFPLERVVAVELVAEVADALVDFKTWNRAVFDDPRVEVIVEDGRNYLLGTDEQFDVIVSDLFIPWHAGTGDLYTVEHFRTVADRLAEGGIFAQWLPGYQLTPDEVRTIVASLAEAFGAVTLWRDDFEQDRPLLCLVCYRDAARLDAAVLAAAAGRLDGRNGPPAMFLSSPLGTCMLYVAGDADLRAWSAGAPKNTDNFPFIEYATPGSYYLHRQRDVSGINKLLAGFRPRTWGYPQPALVEPPMDVALRAADLMCDAQTARAANNFQQEFRCLEQLIPLAGDVPGVAEHVLRVAARYRQRNMADRGDELLLALTSRPQAPIVALLALADLRRTEGKLPDAIDLLSRAVERVPQAAGIRRSLLDLLKETKQHTLIETHLRYLLETNPDEPYLRLDLAQALDRQGKTEDARAQIEVFRGLRLGDDRKNAWRYLRGLELGKYVDEAPPQQAASAPGDPAAQPDEPAGQP